MDIKLDIYNEGCLALADSMYLKFDLHALQTECWYQGTTDIDMDRTKWLHYQNLSGMYHAYNEPMTIKSLDTFEDISFDKDTLKLHPTTLTLYREFGKYYNALVEAYPNNSALIKGILYDVSIEEIIAMDDFHIIGCNTNLIDVQEYDLIETLNRHLNIMGTKVGCPDYVMADPLYSLAIMDYVVSHLTPTIKRVRMDKSKTYTANTFYIWSNINSVINLDEYRSILTYDDTMFLFKNILRLKNGLCSKAVFLEILTTIITPKMISAYYLESNTDVSSMNIDTMEVSADWTVKNVLNTDTKISTLSGVAKEHTERSPYKVKDAERDITDQLYRDYNSNVYPELTLYDDREREGDVRELLVNVDYSYLFGGLGTITRYYSLILPNTGEEFTLQHKDWLTIYSRLNQIRLGSKTDIVPCHKTTQLYRYTPISVSDMISRGLPAERANRIFDMIGGFPNVINDTGRCLDYVSKCNANRDTVVALLEQSYTTDNAITLDEVYGDIFESYAIRIQPDNTNFVEWMDSVGIDVDSMDEATRVQMEYLILTNVVGISGDSADKLVNLIGSMLYKFISYKTNISKRMSEKLTLGLGSRPTWIEIGDDNSGMVDMINVSVDARAVITSDISSDIELNETDIEITMTKDIGTDMVDMRAGDTITESNINKIVVNLNPMTLTAEILE